MGIQFINSGLEKIRKIKLKNRVEDEWNKFTRFVFDATLLKSSNGD